MKSKKPSFDPIFHTYINLAEILAKFFAPHLEVVIHDYSNPKKSVIAVFNSQITGRQVGDSLTEIGRARVEGEKDIPDELINYQNRSADGKILKSASIAIRNEKKELKGSFCLNYDISFFNQIDNFLQSFIQTTQSPLNTQSEFILDANFASIEKSINSVMTEKGFVKDKLSGKSKKIVVLELKNQGVLQLRGAVEVLAKELGLTRATIYNYLKED